MDAALHRSTGKQSAARPSEQTISFEGVVQKTELGPFHPRTDTVEPAAWYVDLERGRLLPQGLSTKEKAALHLARSVDPSSFVFAIQRCAWIPGISNQPETAPGRD